MMIFDGISQFVDVGNSPLYSPGPDGFTVSAWVRPDALDFVKSEPSSNLAEGSYVNFLGKSQYGNPNTEEWEFRLYSKHRADGTTLTTRPNRVSFYLFSPTGGQGTGGYFQDTLVAGQWMHVAGKIANGHVSIYRDGVLRQSVAYSLVPKPTTAPLRFGHCEDGSHPGFFPGALAGIRIYQTALADADIAALHDAGCPPLVGEWP